MQHIASRGWFSATDKSPADSSAGEFIEKGRVHQQRFIADEALPVAGVTVWIPTEVVPAEHIDQITPSRKVATTATEQFQAGVPVIVPTAFPLQAVDLLGAWAPTAVVLNGLLKSSPVAAGDIADHTVDVEQQDAGLVQIVGGERLVG